MTKRKPKPARTLSEVVFQEWEATGEVTGLGVLADWHQEREEKPELADLLRCLMGDVERAEAVRFYYTHAGCGYNPTEQTKEEGAVLNAVQLADALEWFGRMDAQDLVRVNWEIDAYADRDWMDPDDGRPLWVCWVDAYESGRWEGKASLGGIDLGPSWGEGQTYRRAVEAELLAETLHWMKRESQ